jgi:CBS domain-containing protein
MTKDVKTVNADATLLEVSKLMNKHRVRRLVVLQDEKVVGIVTVRDIIELVSL